MCIAIYSPVSNPVPADDTLRICFRNNSDGAGYAFNNDSGKVTIRKGFMTIDSFLSAFHKDEETYGFKDRGVLLHFRIATHGGTTAKCCHPFPLVSDEKKLQQSSIISDYAVIHNGIIKLTSDAADNKKHMSDTMVFIRDYMTRIASNKHWFRNPQNMELIEKLASSKIAVLNGSGIIHSTSGFEKAEDGNYYSNDSYKHTYLFEHFIPYRGWYDYYMEDFGETELMRLSPGDIACFDDGTTEEYDENYHEECPLFCDDAGSMFQSFEGDCCGRRVNMNSLSYIGNGMIITEKDLMSKDILETFEFRKDCVGYFAEEEVYAG